MLLSSVCGLGGFSIELFPHGCEIPENLERTLFFKVLDYFKEAYVESRKSTSSFGS